MYVYLHNICIYMYTWTYIRQSHAELHGEFSSLTLVLNILFSPQTHAHTPTHTHNTPHTLNICTKHTHIIYAHVLIHLCRYEHTNTHKHTDTHIIPQRIFSLIQAAHQICTFVADGVQVTARKILFPLFQNQTTRHNTMMNFCTFNHDAKKSCFLSFKIR